MNQSLEIINLKNEATESTLNDRLEISTEMHSYKQEDSYFIHTEMDIKTEIQDEREFPVSASTLFGMCPNYYIKCETKDPLIKIEYEDIADELIHDPLDFGNEIKAEEFPIDMDQGQPRIKSEPIERENDENLLENHKDNSHESRLNKDQLLIRKDTNRKDKKYVCSECNKIFRQKCHLDDHLRIHTGEKPFTCDVCEKLFNKKSHLNEHKLIHSDQKPHICDVCSKGFKQKSGLKHHKLIHSRVIAFSCDVCDQSFTLKHHLVIHKRMHTDEEQFPIDLGQWEKGQFKINTEPIERKNDENILEIHKDNSHGSRSHKDQLLIENDTDRKDKKYVCRECNKIFRQKCHFNDHLRIHTGEKLFTCDVCEKLFSKKSHLNEHKLIHSDQKPYICDVCSKGFKQKSGLKHHRLIHSGMKAFSCDVCDHSFTLKHHLVIHKRMHAGEKPFACDVCKKAFTGKSDLTVHRRTHTGEKPYSCDICNKAFSRKSIVNTHKRTHKN